MVRELVTGKVNPVYASTIQGRVDRWNAELWNKVYGFKQKGEDMATKKDDCTRDRLSQKLDSKYGYFLKDCKDKRGKRMLAFLVPILSLEKPNNVTLTLANTLFLAYSGKRVVDWGSIIGELVHILLVNMKRGQPSYIGPFLFHLYKHGNLLTMEDKILWTRHQIMWELQTTDSKPEAGQENSKYEETVELSNEERPMSKKKKLREGSPLARTKVAGGTSTFPSGDNPVDSIIRDLEAVRSQIAE